MVQKFVAASPEAQVIGQALLALRESINFSEFESAMARYGLISIQTDAYYPYQLLLDFYKALASTPNGSEDLVSIGVKIIETAILPPEINSVPTALNLLNGMIQMNMQNTGDERYEVTPLGPNQYQVLDYTAFPHDLIYGFLYGILRRFAFESTKRVLKRTYLNQENPDMGGARYEVEW